MTLWASFACVSPPGKNIRVVDPFTIKPLDAATILSAARATGGRIITVEDHYKEGTLVLWFIHVTVGRRVDESTGVDSSQSDNHTLF